MTEIDQLKQKLKSKLREREEINFKLSQEITELVEELNRREGI